MTRKPVADFQKYLNQVIHVKIQGNPGRYVKGVLKGFDGMNNLLLDASVEACTIRQEKVERQLGLTILRGTNIEFVTPNPRVLDHNPFLE